MTRRSRVLVATLRCTTSVALLGALYAVLPFDARPDPVTLVELALGLGVLATMATWQVRAITRSPYPVLRAVEALSLTVPLFVLLFSTSYVLLASARPGSFSQPLDRVAALYFTVTVLATVGFGDIAPVSAPARLLVTGQMIADLVLLGLVVRAMADAARRGRARRDGIGR